ncbi:hypothetical protein [Algibacter sp. L1A34]|uniref:hypothetical protein n=1 Tax=Algibacter sp. L1A34 TaxID=2686365 RepID=UPI00131A7174|nr:hypothetical protein [Algibacter sp. L1A34]
MDWYLAGFIADILLWFQDFKFWLKKRKRRKFEKEHGLPKSVMMRPSVEIRLKVFVGIIVLFSAGGLLLFSIRGSDDSTQNQLIEITGILKQEKEDIGCYPEKLNVIIRNNPLRKGLVLDRWKREFHYELLNNSTEFRLQSLGPDGELNTNDDIKLKE